MPKPYLLNTKVYNRVKAINFSPASLASERVESCDLCGSSAFTIVSELDRYGLPVTFMLCDGCGLVFQNPRPSEAGYSQFYEQC